MKAADTVCAFRAAYWRIHILLYATLDILTGHFTRSVAMRKKKDFAQTVCRSCDPSGWHLIDTD